MSKRLKCPRACETCFLLSDDQHTHARGAGAEAAISLIAQPPLVLEDRRAEDARCKAGSAGILSFMKGSKPDEPGPASEDRRLREGRRGQVSRTRYLPTPSIAPSGGSPRACEAGGVHRCSSGIRLLPVSPDAMESEVRA